METGMKVCQHKSKRSWRSLLRVLACAPLLLAVACEGDTGPAGPQGPQGEPGDPPTTSTIVPPGVEGPGLVAAVTSVTGGSGSGGNVLPGDMVTVNFTLKKTDGSDWAIEEIGSGRAMISGPTFNYNRVIAQQSDVVSAAVTNADGSFSYTFPTPVPATYLAPLNDTPSFGPEDGELTGQALLDGTYTVGMYFSWNYTVGSSSEREVGDVTFDFLLGNAATLESRELIKQENCNNCHTNLQFHGGQRRATTLCLLCHTAGAEDKNEPSAGGGTPDVTIDFRIMIHKIHNGSNLPSVLGVTTDASGARDYTATPKPYQLVGFGNNVHDYSGVQFPQWPALVSPTAKDTGWGGLHPDDQSTEDTIRKGSTNCDSCHGDPDGSGPVSPPAQGEQIYTQLRRNTCGSCHDDVVWTHPYTANTQTMPPQLTDATCLACHPASGSHLSAREAHLHPMLDPSLRGGLNIVVSSVDEAGTNDGDSTIDPGEKIAVTLTIQDDMGIDVAPASLSGLNIGVSGPTNNMQMLAYSSLPTTALTGGPVFTVNVPEKIWFEHVGDATAGADVFVSALTPHWNLAGMETVVYERTATGGGSSTVATAVGAPSNYIDVADGSGFARDEWIVVDDGNAGQEYLLLQWVEGDRLWFSSLYTPSYPLGPRNGHAVGVSVDEVTLVALTEDTEYTLTEATGTITETGGFTDGNPIVVTYTSDYIMPTVYGVPPNGDAILGDDWGSWRGLPIEDGTYSVALWGTEAFSFNLWGEANSYSYPNHTEDFDFLVGDAAMIEEYDLISSENNCYDCHVDIAFHGGGRRGFEACIICHGPAASGDRPQYVAAGAPATPDVTVNFRTLLHKLHMGSSLDDASGYVVAGYGFQAWPNNFGTSTYENLAFTSMPDGVKECGTCHGEGNTAWREPAARDHSGGQLFPTRSWRATCGSCHDSASTQAHIDANTAPLTGAESCATCHGDGKTWNVPTMHMTR
jgi:Outer membrane cytochrome MtrC/MtrF-like, domains II/IV